MLLNGTLVVAWGPGILEWSPASHEGLPSRYIHCTKKHALRPAGEPGADCCLIAPLTLKRGSLNGL